MISLEELGRIFARYGLREQFHEQEPLFYWAEVVGERIAQMTRPLRVHSGVLYVEVTSPVQAHALELLKEKYIKKLNARLGENRIKDIRFRASGIVRSPPEKGEKMELEEIELRPEERAEITETVSAITDKRLRSALQRLLETERRVEHLRARLGFHRCPRCGVLHDGLEELCFYCQLEAGSGD